MPTAEFLQLIVVALIAGYIGYRLGLASAGRPAGGMTEADMTGGQRPLSVPESVPQYRERTGAPPPAANAGPSATPGGNTGRTPPRRSSAPPPAAAGLMGRGDDKS